MTTEERRDLLAQHVDRERWSSFKEVMTWLEARGVTVNNANVIRQDFNARNIIRIPLLGTKTWIYIRATSLIPADYLEEFTERMRVDCHGLRKFLLIGARYYGISLMVTEGTGVVFKKLIRQCMVSDELSGIELVLSDDDMVYIITDNSEPLFQLLRSML